MEHKRLESLDILRGADMFLLTTLGPILIEVTGGRHDGIMAQFHHVKWEGFCLWDLIMPLFMFMAGVTIPYSLEKYINSTGLKSKAWFRISRRVIILWILGMVAQGNLLKFDWSSLKFYSNTLQSIAIGYLVCSSIYLYCQKTSVHIGTCVALLVSYWAAMMFIRVGEFGGGDFTREHNLAQLIDDLVLSTHRDGMPGRYFYTWILSSLTFASTVMMGMISGELLRSKCRRQSQILIITGVACAALGWLWGYQMPVIKKIWTSSMVLVSGGYSMILLGVFHWMIDEAGCGKKILGWLTIYGQNAIVAYMVMECGYLVHLNAVANVALVVSVLLFCWWRQLFFKV